MLPRDCGSLSFTLDAFTLKPTGFCNAGVKLATHVKFDMKVHLRKGKVVKQMFQRNERIYTVQSRQTTYKSAFEESSGIRILRYDRPEAGSQIPVTQFLSHQEQDKRQYTDYEDKNKG